MKLRKSETTFFIDGDFGIIAPRNMNSIEPHTHDFAEFSYVFSGKCTHIVNGVKFNAQKGDLLFINYNSVHEIEVPSSVNYADVLLKPQFVDRSLKGEDNAFSLLKLDAFKSFSNVISACNCLVHFSAREQKKFETLILGMVDEQNCIQSGCSLVLSSYLNIFLTMVFRKMALPMEKDFSLNEKMLDYIKSNACESLSMNFVAGKCGYNPQYFSRAFKKLFGYTFTEYVTKCRINKACDLIVKTSFSIERIMCECGFSDRTGFFRSFRELTGCTPSEYKNTNKKLIL